MTTRLKLLLPAALLGALAIPSSASTLYGVEFAGQTPVYTIDQATGGLTSLTVLPVSEDIGDLTSDWRLGSFTLWGIDIPNNELVEYDPATGMESNRTPITGTEGSITSIAFDVVSGTLYGNTTQAFSGSQILYTIDPLTGNAAFVGGLQYANIFALGFDLDGTLYGVDDSSNSFLNISTTDASAALIANLDYQSFDLAVRPEDGVLFAVNSTAAALATVDKNTGAATNLGALVLAGEENTHNIVGLAFSPEAAVPEPGTFAIAGLGLLALGLFRRRR